MQQRRIDGRDQFHVQRAGDEVEPAVFNIVRLVVDEKLPDGEWAVAWELRGEKQLSSIEYGVPQGLQEVRPAKALSRDARYRASANEYEWPNPKGYASAAFRFDDRGQVVVETTAAAGP